MENLFIISRDIPGHGKRKFYLGFRNNEPFWFTDLQDAYTLTHKEVDLEWRRRETNNHLMKLYSIEQVQ